jgi:transposase
MRSLAQRFGVHRTTISKHLERVGATKRPKIKMTEERLAEARKLYTEGWSTQRIARKLDLGQTTVYDALKNAGVQMRGRGSSDK